MATKTNSMPAPYRQYAKKRRRAPVTNGREPDDKSQRSSFFIFTVFVVKVTKLTLSQLAFKRRRWLLCPTFNLRAASVCFVIILGSDSINGSKVSVPKPTVLAFFYGHGTWNHGGSHRCFCLYRASSCSHCYHPCSLFLACLAWWYRPRKTS